MCRKVSLVFVLFLLILLIGIAHSAANSSDNKGITDIRNNPNNWFEGNVKNPYEKVNWKEHKQICSTSHMHITTQML